MVRTHVWLGWQYVPYTWCIVYSSFSYKLLSAFYFNIHTCGLCVSSPRQWFDTDVCCTLTTQPLQQWVSITIFDVYRALNFMVQHDDAFNISFQVLVLNIREIYTCVVYYRLCFLIHRQWFDADVCCTLYDWTFPTSSVNISIWLRHFKLCTWYMYSNEAFYISFQLLLLNIGEIVPVYTFDRLFVIFQAVVWCTFMTEHFQL